MKSLTVATRDVPRAILGLREFRVTAFERHDRADGLTDLEWEPSAPHKNTGQEKPCLRVVVRFCANEGCCRPLKRGPKRYQGRFCCRSCQREATARARRLEAEKRRMGGRCVACAYCGKKLPEDAHWSARHCNERCKRRARNVAMRDASNMANGT